MGKVPILSIVFMYVPAHIVKESVTLYQINPTFNDPKKKKMLVENVLGKRENAGNQHFLFYPERFLPFSKQISFFCHIYFVVCKCFEFGLV